MSRSKHCRPGWSRRENPLRMGVIKSEGARTLLQIALRKDDQLLGALSYGTTRAAA